jgi:hypothetical protein
VPQNQCGLSARGGAAAPPGGMCHLSLPAWPAAAGPTPANGRHRPVSCRLRVWRHPRAGSGPGGTSHVSPAQGCRHRQVVFFGNLFQMWSFLTIHWRRWSVSSKIRPNEHWADLCFMYYSIRPGPTQIRPKWPLRASTMHSLRCCFAALAMFGWFNLGLDDVLLGRQSLQH